MSLITIDEATGERIECQALTRMGTRCKSEHGYWEVAGVWLCDVDAIQEDAHRWDILAPVLDPTAYRNSLHDRNNDLGKEIISAFMTFHASVLKATEKHLRGISHDHS